MKLIFLDVDGVLNDRDTIRLASWENMPNTSHFNRELVERVKRLQVATGASFVISSTWRREFATEEEMLLFFKKCGFDPDTIIGRTPIGFPGQRMSEYHAVRGREIQAWINSFPRKNEIESIIILDDNADMGHLNHRLIQTGTWVGITEEDVVDAIALMNTPDTAHVNYTFKR